MKRLDRLAKAETLNKVSKSSAMLPTIKYCPGMMPGPKCPGRELRRDYILYQPKYRYVSDVYENYLKKLKRRKQFQQLYRKLKASETRLNTSEL